MFRLRQDGAVSDIRPATEPNYRLLVGVRLVRLVSSRSERRSDQVPRRGVPEYVATGASGRGTLSKTT